jgi:hypothetical protein
MRVASRAHPHFDQMGIIDNKARFLCASWGYRDDIHEETVTDTCHNHHPCKYKLRCRVQSSRGDSPLGERQRAKVMGPDLRTRQLIVLAAYDNPH